MNLLFSCLVVSDFFCCVRFFHTCVSTEGDERVSRRYSDRQFVLPGGIEALAGDMRNFRHNLIFHDLSFRMETAKNGIN